MSILIATNCKNSERYYNTDSVLYRLLFLRRQPLPVAAAIFLAGFFRSRDGSVIKI